MPFNGSGTFTPYSPGNPVVTNTTISSTAFNNTINDIATGLSTAITKDGQTTATANLPMGGYKLTGLGAGSAATDSANLSQVQSGVAALLGGVAGTNAITATGSPTLTAYASGQTFRFIPAATNTGATTINIDSLGAKNVYANGVACIGGEIVSGVPTQVMYDGTQFNIVGPFNGVINKNLGLGVTPSAWNTAGKAVEVGFLGNAVYSTAANTRYDTSNAFLNSGGDWKYAANGYATAYTQYNGTHTWQYAGSGTAGNTISWTEGLKLDGSARLLVGTTSILTGAGSYRLHVAGVGGVWAQGTGPGDASYVSKDAGGTVAYHFAGLNSSGTVVVAIAANGNITNTNNSYGAISDRKLKQDITDATPKLADLLNVRVVNYRLKANPEHKQLGVIAQELEQVFPALVDESADYDEQGNDLGTTTKSVKYSVFVPILIKAIQELKAEFDTYKAAHP